MATEPITIDNELTLTVNASINKVFERLVYNFAEGMEGEKGASMKMKMEQWPGGRWFRDLGDNNGHLWGTVQSIKAPTLLELYGQMFMSYPALNHLHFRLSETDQGTKIFFRYQAFGLIDKSVRDEMSGGWKEMLDKVVADCK